MWADRGGGERGDARVRGEARGPGLRQGGVFQRQTAVPAGGRVPAARGAAAAGRPARRYEDAANFRFGFVYVGSCEVVKATSFRFDLLRSVWPFLDADGSVVLRPGNKYEYSFGLELPQQG